MATVQAGRAFRNHPRRGESMLYRELTFRGRYCMHGIRPAISMILCAALLSLGSQRLAAQGSATKSISAWAKCGGGGDEYDGVARAFQAARHSAFTLLVDCPVRIHIGRDIARAIFVDDG